MANNNNNFVLKLVLTNFLGANISYVENEEGELEECVCIPLERNNLNTHLLVVIRYFGGTKLGAGPLLRSYSKAANEVIK